MWRYSALLLATLLPSTPAPRRVAAAPEAFIGRWDLTVRTPEGNRPSWIEIRHSGREALVGRFVGPVGSARPIAKVELTGDGMRFAVPPQWEQEAGDIVVEGRPDGGGGLAGSMTLGDGKRLEWTARRAPTLRRSAPPQWGTPVRLIAAGGGLAGWHALGEGENQWRVENGVLRSPKSGVNLATDRTFGDFKLHLEFRYPRGSNSGVYLRGRYEAQIEDVTRDTLPAPDIIGSIYGFLTPSEVAARKPDEWQTYDITLVGRMVTLVLNGKTVVCNQEIPGPTGGALDSDEAAPGPLYLQGDHGPIEYRNITITPAR
ncbi:MAG TPA: DUF1080 domain-containing protein [Gemmatimonadaceae bacterium]|nr:DUF1080 domain-containing protein [Gemmatimonadaceae bacterium]